MANGDAAAAAGMDTVPGTADLRNGYDEINKSRDYLAAHQTSGTHPASAINSGKLDAARLPFQPVEQGGAPGMQTNRIRLGWNGSNRLLLYVDDVSIGPLALDGIYQPAPPGTTWNGPVNTQNGDLYTGAGTLVTPGGRNFTVVQSWAAAALDVNGRLGIQPSARRFKKNIREWADDERLDAFMTILDRSYQLRASVDGSGEGPELLGWIADEVADAGFPELVAYDTDPDSAHVGEPISINYSNAVVPLHAELKRQRATITTQQQTIDDLLERVARLEGNTDA